MVCKAIDNILAPLELYPVFALAGNIPSAKANNSLINIPIHHTGKLELITWFANADVNLSVAEPIREADADPIIIPMSAIIAVELVKSNTVLGSFSAKISNTSDEPASLVKNTA